MLRCRIEEGAKAAGEHSRGILCHIFLYNEQFSACHRDISSVENTHGPACSTASHVIKNRTREGSVNAFRVRLRVRLTERESPASQT